MSLKTQAKTLQKIGYKNSGQDSMLAHITPQEAGLLKMFGGSGRIDPATGLRHFDFGGGGPENPGGDGGGGFGGGDGGLGEAGGFGTGGNAGDGSDGGYGWGGFGGETGDNGWGNTGSFGDASGGDLAALDLGLESFSDYSNEGMNYSGPTGLNAATDGIFGTQSTDPDFLSRLLPFTKKQLLSKAISSLAQTNPALGTLASIVGPVAMSPSEQTPLGQQIAGRMVDVIAAPVQGPVQALTGLANLFGANINLPTMGQGLAKANLDYKGMPSGMSGFGNSTTGQTSTGGNMFDQAMGLAGGLGGLYSMYSQNQGNNRYMDGLSGMYGQNSPFAQQLRQQLARKDAASGRRSQYGPREVELQARLAQMQAGLAPSMIQGRQNNFSNSMQMFQQLGAMNKAGLFDGLKGLFSGGSGGGSGGFEMPQTAWGDSSLAPTDNSFSDGWDW